MAKSVTLDRASWLGHRWRGHGLDGDATTALLDDLLLLGVQDSRHGGAQQSLTRHTSRIGSTSICNAISPDGPLVIMWSVRGAPHVHRSNELDLVRDALAPDESDDGGAAYVAAVHAVAAALQKVVSKPSSKADASANRQPCSTRDRIDDRPRPSTRA